jgi:hypothetical protein
VASCWSFQWRYENPRDRARKPRGDGVLPAEDALKSTSLRHRLCVGETEIELRCLLVPKPLSREPGWPASELPLDNTSAELKAFIDCLGGLWFQGKLNGKAASAFTSTAGPHGGNETTVVSLYIPMAHLGFIIVPNGYTHEKIVQGHGTPYGSSSISGQNSTPPTADDLELALSQVIRSGRSAVGLLVLTPSMRRPVEVKQDLHPLLFLGKVSSAESPLSPPFHPHS